MQKFISSNLASIYTSCNSETKNRHYICDKCLCAINWRQWEFFYQQISGNFTKISTKNITFGGEILYSPPTFIGH